MKKKRKFTFRTFLISVLMVTVLVVVLLFSQQENFLSAEVAQTKLYELCDSESPALVVEGVDQPKKLGRMSDLFVSSSNESSSSKSQVCMLEVIDGELTFAHHQYWYKHAEEMKVAEHLQQIADSEREEVLLT